MIFNKNWLVRFLPVKAHFERSFICRIDFEVVQYFITKCLLQQKLLFKQKLRNKVSGRCVTLGTVIHFKFVECVYQYTFGIFLNMVRTYIRDVYSWDKALPLNYNVIRQNA